MISLYSFWWPLNRQTLSKYRSLLQSFHVIFFAGLKRKPFSCICFHNRCMFFVKYFVSWNSQNSTLFLFNWWYLIKSIDLAFIIKSFDRLFLDNPYFFKLLLFVVKIIWLLIYLSLQKIHNSSILSKDEHKTDSKSVLIFEVKYLFISKIAFRYTNICVVRSSWFNIRLIAYFAFGWKGIKKYKYFLTC